MSEPVRQPVFVFEGFRLDAQRRVLIGVNAQPITLTPRLFDTLLYFVERAGQLWVAAALALRSAIRALRRVTQKSGSVVCLRSRSSARTEQSRVCGFNESFWGGIK